MRKFLFAVALLIARPACAEDVQVATPTGTLAGTLTAAKSAFAAALILPGSGPTDRDGNGVNGSRVHGDTYRLLAEAMVARGVTTLRIDKRGIGASAAALMDESKLVFGDNAQDADVWIADLKRRSGFSCVWLLGHSEGALVAEVAAADNKDVCGLVLLEGAGRKAGNVLRMQVTATENITPEMRAATYQGITQLEKGQPIAAPPPELTFFRPAIQPYMMSWLALDPAALLAKLKLPVLIVQGDHDLQVNMDDAHRLAAARPDAKLLVVPGMNHLLKAAPADRAGNMATYTDPNLLLAPGVGDAVADFIRQAR